MPIFHPEYPNIPFKEMLCLFDLDQTYDLLIAAKLGWYAAFTGDKEQYNMFFRPFCGGGGDLKILIDYFAPTTGAFANQFSDLLYSYYLPFTGTDRACIPGEIIADIAPFAQINLNNWVVELQDFDAEQQIALKITLPAGQGKGVISYYLDETDTQFDYDELNQLEIANCLLNRKEIPFTLNNEPQIITIRYGENYPVAGTFVVSHPEPAVVNAINNSFDSIWQYQFLPSILNDLTLLIFYQFLHYDQILWKYDHKAQYMISLFNYTEEYYSSQYRYFYDESSNGFDYDKIRETLFPFCPNLIYDYNGNMIGAESFYNGITHYTTPYLARAIVHVYIDDTFPKIYQYTQSRPDWYRFCYLFKANNLRGEEQNRSDIKTGNIFYTPYGYYFEIPKTSYQLGLQFPADVTGEFVTNYQINYHKWALDWNYNILYDEPASASIEVSRLVQKYSIFEEYLPWITYEQWGEAIDNYNASQAPPITGLYTWYNIYNDEFRGLENSLEVNTITGYSDSLPIKYYNQNQQPIAYQWWRDVEGHREITIQWYEKWDKAYPRYDSAWDQWSQNNSAFIDYHTPYKEAIIEVKSQPISKEIATEYTTLWETDIIFTPSMPNEWEIIKNDYIEFQTIYTPPTTNLDNADIMILAQEITWEDYLNYYYNDLIEMVDSQRLKEIHAALQADKFAWMPETTDTLRNANLGYYIERLARVMGISVNPDGSLRTIRPKKFIKAGETIPSGWYGGCFGINNGGSLLGQPGGLPEEDRDGIVYEIKCNNYDPDNGTIEVGGYALCENWIQYMDAMQDDLDKALGWQELGAVALPSGDGTKELVLEGLAEIIAEVFFNTSAITTNSSGTHATAIGTNLMVREILSGLGLPLIEKVFEVDIGAAEGGGFISYPGYDQDSTRISTILFSILQNIGFVLASKLGIETIQDTLTGGGL